MGQRRETCECVDEGTYVAKEEGEKIHMSVWSRYPQD